MKDKLDLEYLKISEEIKQALSNVERKAKEHREKKEQEELER